MVTVLPIKNTSAVYSWLNSDDSGTLPKEYSTMSERISFAYMSPSSCKRSCRYISAVTNCSSTMSIWTSPRACWKNGMEYRAGSPGWPTTRCVVEGKAVLMTFIRTSHAVSRASISPTFTTIDPGASFTGCQLPSPSGSISRPDCVAATKRVMKLMSSCPAARSPASSPAVGG